MKHKARLVCLVILTGAFLLSFSSPLWSLDTGQPQRGDKKAIETVKQKSVKTPMEQTPVEQKKLPRLNERSPGHKINKVLSLDEMKENYFYRKKPLTSFMITTNSFPFGVAGQEYKAEIYTLNGGRACNWTATGLPQGLILEERGLGSETKCTNAEIKGVPIETGNFSVKIKVVDNTNIAKTAEKQFNLHIDDNIAMNVSSAAEFSDTAKLAKLIDQSDYDVIKLNPKWVLKFDVTGYADSYNWSLGVKENKGNLLTMSEVPPYLFHRHQDPFGISDIGKSPKTRYVFVADDKGLDTVFSDVKVSADDGAGNKASITIGSLTFGSAPLKADIEKITIAGKEHKSNEVLNVECEESTSVKFKVSGGKPPYKWCIVTAASLDVDEKLVKDMDFDACAKDKEWTDAGGAWSAKCEDSDCQTLTLTGVFDTSGPMWGWEYYENVGAYVKDANAAAGASFPSQLSNLTYWASYPPPEAEKIKDLTMYVKFSLDNVGSYGADIEFGLRDSNENPLASGGWFTFDSGGSKSFSHGVFSYNPETGVDKIYKVRTEASQVNGLFDFYDLDVSGDYILISGRYWYAFAGDGDYWTYEVDDGHETDDVLMSQFDTGGYNGGIWFPRCYPKSDDVENKLKGCVLGVYDDD